MGGGGMLATAELNMVFSRWFFNMVFQDVRSRQDGGRRGSMEVPSLGAGGTCPSRSRTHCL